ncbi:MAG TPA: hypothetical protein VH518_02070 [Tepidisphaeraceae bacterium]|jgi:hypothetical protein
MACQLICPNLRCRKILSVPDDVRGRLVKCQHCQTMFRVPEGKKAVPVGAGAAATPASAGATATAVKEQK